MLLLLLHAGAAAQERISYESGMRGPSRSIAHFLLLVDLHLALRFTSLTDGFSTEHTSAVPVRAAALPRISSKCRPRACLWSLEAGPSNNDPAFVPTNSALEPIDEVLTANHLLSFERNGYLRIPKLLSAPEVRTLKEECLKSMERGRSDAVLHALNTNGEEFDPPFLQHFNPWRNGDAAGVGRFCLSGRLASIAAGLLNADRVRLYQDCIFLKRPGDAPTDWHADLKMVPLDTNQFVTVWIALNNVPAYDDGGSGLHFIEGSHHDFALPFWYGAELTKNDGGPDFDLTERYGDRIVEQDEPMQPGDSTWHHGWTLHSAPDLFDDETEDRIAYTASYVADPVRMLGEGALGRQDGEDSISYEDWIGFGPGEVVAHEFLPIVWPQA